MTIQIPKVSLLKRTKITVVGWHIQIDFGGPLKCLPPYNQHNMPNEAVLPQPYSTIHIYYDIHNTNQKIIPRKHI